MDFIDFLRPSYLWALPLAAGPIIIHLLSRRRKRIVEFSSISLLLAARQKNVERLNLREILLLLMRTLIVLFLLLAMARPVVRGLGGTSIGDHEPTAVVMLLDGTLSMRYASAGETSFERAIAGMREVLGYTGSEDRVRILVCGPAGPGPFDFAGELRPHEAGSRLELLEPAAVHRTLDDCLKRALSVAGTMDLPWKEVHVFTDLQETSFGAGLPGDAPENIPIVFLPAGDPDPVNRFVGSADLLRREGASEKPWSVTALIGAGGRPGDPTVFPRLYFDDDMQGIVEVRAVGEEPVPAAFSLESYPGEGRRIRVEIDRDGLAADDVRYLTAGGEMPLHISRGEGVDSSLPLRLALDLIEGGRDRAPDGERNGVKGAGVAGRESEPPPFRVHVTFWSDREGIREAIERGTGLVLFPHPERVEPYQGGPVPFEAGGELVLEEGLFRAVRMPIGAGAPPGVARLGKGLERISVSRYHEIDLLPGSAYAAGAWTVILEGGDPLLVGGQTDRSRLVVWSVAPERGSSTLFSTPLFVPLLDATLRYAAGGHAVEEHFCGIPARRQIPGLGRGEALTVRLPGGSEIVVRAEEPGELVVAETGEPGFYTVTRGGEVVDVFAVNVDTRESDLSRIGEDELASLYAPREVRVVRTGERLEEAIFSRRGGKELSGLFFAAVLVLMMTESLVSGRIRGV